VVLLAVPLLLLVLLLLLAVPPLLLVLKNTNIESQIYPLEKLYGLGLMNSMLNTQNFVIFLHTLLLETLFVLIY
jgi:hypothetical protein